MLAREKDSAIAASASHADKLPVAETPIISRGPAGWLSVEAACVALGVSVPTLARWRSKGTGPTFAKLGARIYYRADAINSWIESRVSR